MLCDVEWNTWVDPWVSAPRCDWGLCDRNALTCQQNPSSRYPEVTQNGEKSDPIAIVNYESTNLKLSTWLGHERLVKPGRLSRGCPDENEAREPWKETATCTQ